MYSTESSGGRLSPLNISDPLLRAELFREIRLAQTDRNRRGALDKVVSQEAGS